MHTTPSLWLHHQQQSLLAITEQLENWRQQSLALLNQPPGAGRWSALQCADHLSQYFDWYLPAIAKVLPKAASKPGNGKRYSSGLLGGYFIKLMQLGSKPMQSPKDKRPGEASQLSLAVLDKLLAQCHQFNESIAQAFAVNLQQTMGISLSPLIRMKLGDVLAFLVVHMQRHLLQGQRALDEVQTNISTLKKDRHVVAA